MTEKVASNYLADIIANHLPDEKSADAFWRDFDAAGLQIGFVAPAPAAMEPSAWECMGRKQSLPEPGECNWPDCGCDPHATKVIESLVEQGWGPPGSLYPTLSEQFERIIKALNYQGGVNGDENSLTVGEIRRAL